MKCDRKKIELLIEDALTFSEAERLTDHLGECTECQQFLDQISGGQQWLCQISNSLKSQIDIDKESIARYRGLLDDFGNTLSDTSKYSNQLSSSIRFSENHELYLDDISTQDGLGRIGEYEVQSIIGKGGMGTVFRVYDPSLDRVLAMKVMNPFYKENPDAVRRFEREARIAAAVVHPSVVPIYGIGSNKKGLPYIVMKLAPGENLKQFISGQGPMSIEESIDVALQVTNGLEAAHKKMLIHRDIKPANIIYDKDSQKAVITDFGLARLVDDEGVTRSGVLAGTPSYMSPEQVNGTDIDHRSDLFSLGATLYFLISGQPPFTGDCLISTINSISQKQPEPLSTFNRDVPPVVNRLVNRLLEKKRENRIQTASQLKDSLQQLKHHLTQPIRIHPPRITPCSFEVKYINQFFITILVGLITFFAIALFIWLVSSGTLHLHI